MTFNLTELSILMAFNLTEHSTGWFLTSLNSLQDNFYLMNSLIDDINLTETSTGWL